ncbi:uncharacterized protein [Temnothorax nylanderi]|uniref:uncharacterized protein isoform X2 n=1 Tax=Temnothorax nylanderi TaxID=102681 RepID=UPI003A8581F2
MDYEIPRDLQMPYLRAIQKIPGDTAGEKWSWMGRLTLHQTSKDLEQLPPELLPILGVETAVRKKRHEDITSALKCEDWTIINRAFKASWFFDSSYKEIVDVSYFCERLFPYISVNTRTRIVLTLARRLTGLLPAEISSFDTDNVLDYLKHYPCDKKYDLLSKSYKSKYHADLLDERKNVTPDLLQLLPAEERIKQARINIEKQKLLLEENDEDTMDYKRAWICYLSVNEAIPVLKERINKTPNESHRLGLILQMIYVCKINEDDDALCNTLTYFLNRHKNEKSWLFERVFDELLQIYDVPHLSEKQISLVLDIVRLFYVKNEFGPDDLLAAIIHFKLIHNMPIKESINMLVGENQWNVNFNILKEYPHYERQCLVTFANVLQKKSIKDLDEKIYNFCCYVGSIYDFNDRCKKSRIKIEEMTIRDYPWLRDAIFEAIRSDDDCGDVKGTLQKKEPELYRSWFPEDIANVTSGAALALLNRDLQNILDNWEKYLAECMKKCHIKSVQHFVRATRWYKDLPIKFADQCMNYIYDKNTDEISSSVVILAILLHGDVVTKIIDSLIPTETTVDTSHPNAKDNYKIVRNLPLSVRLSNPPVPLDLVVRLCEGDYLSIALMTLTNVCKRTALPKVMSIVQKLMSMRVSTRKHGVRLMCLVASVSELADFLQNTWAIENHHSVRQVLFKALQNFFLTKPSPETWSLYCQAMSTLSLQDELLLSEIKLFPEISNEYILKYLELWLKTIGDLEGLGLDDQKTNKYIANCLATLTASVLNLLPEEFAENILRRFLFHINTNVSEAARHFTISYILPDDGDKNTARIKVFADVFNKAVTTYWNVPHPNKLRFYPINNALRLFIDDFIVSYVDKSCFNKPVNPEIIDNMQTIFLSVLSPRQDARSYLLLVYAKKLQECTSTKTSLGLRLGQQLHELSDVFSSLLIPFMAKVLEDFLIRVYKHSDLEEVKFSVIEGLIEAGNMDSCFMAVTMLPSTIQTKHLARYDRLVEKFREMEEPTVTILYDHLNETDLKTVDD